MLAGQPEAATQIWSQTDSTSRKHRSTIDSNPFSLKIY